MRGKREVSELEVPQVKGEGDRTPSPLQCGFEVVDPFEGDVRPDLVGAPAFRPHEVEDVPAEVDVALASDPVKLRIGKLREGETEVREHPLDALAAPIEEGPRSPGGEPLRESERKRAKNRRACPVASVLCGVSEVHENPPRSSRSRSQLTRRGASAGWTSSSSTRRDRPRSHRGGIFTASLSVVTQAIRAYN